MANGPIMPNSYSKSGVGVSFSREWEKNDPSNSKKAQRAFFEVEGLGVKLLNLSKFMILCSEDHKLKSSLFSREEKGIMFKISPDVRFLCSFERGNLVSIALAGESKKEEDLDF